MLNLDSFSLVHNVIYQVPDKTCGAMQASSANDLIYKRDHCTGHDAFSYIGHMEHTIKHENLGVGE